MGKVNVCLKRSYIIVTSVIAILSALLLAVTLFSHGYFHEDEEIDKMFTIRVMYVISIVNLLLTIIGVYGACKEKQWALIVFAVGMILSSLFMIISEIHGLAIRPQVAEDLKKQYLHMLPLANASEAFIDGLKDVQMEVVAVLWTGSGLPGLGYNISESCLCAKESTNPCVAAPRNSRLFERMGDDQPIMIYKESCLPHLIMHEMTTINAALGVILGVILLWVLSVVLCIVILCRLRRKEDPPAVVYSPEAKTGDYTELAGAVEYS